MTMDSEDIHEIRQLVQEEANKVVKSIEKGWFWRGFKLCWGAMLAFIIVFFLFFYSQCQAFWHGMGIQPSIPVEVKGVK